MGIDIDGRNEHFGNVRDYITTITKEKYLSTEVDDETRKITYSWGPRALLEVSRHEILNFVCSVSLQLYFSCLELVGNLSALFLFSL